MAVDDHSSRFGEGQPARLERCFYRSPGRCQTSFGLRRESPTLVRWSVCFKKGQILQIGKVGLFCSAVLVTWPWMTSRKNRIRSKCCFPEVFAVRQALRFYFSIFFSMEALGQLPVQTIWFYHLQQHSRNHKTTVQCSVTIALGHFWMSINYALYCQTFF